MSELAARREARRRKILENSTSRLKRITNVNDNLLDEVPITNVNDTVPLTNEEARSHEIEPELDLNDPTLNVIYGNNIPSRHSQTSDISEIKSAAIVIRQVVLIFLAILTRHIYLIANYTQKIELLIQYKLNYIFLPFFTFEVLDFAFYKQFLQQSYYFNVLYLLNIGLSAETMSKIIFLVGILLYLIQDFMVYTFMFISFGKIIDLLADFKIYLNL
ncbi:hypothetical protein FQA39_LY01452 [Lamprigera yunnana]|nr:hypothetical protein FQA39_LY01452 [Lamprigera yunnana]